MWRAHGTWRGHVGHREGTWDIERVPWTWRECVGCGEGTRDIERVSGL